MADSISPFEALSIVAAHLPARLGAAGLYDIDAYGWLDSDIVDPEYLGHAMWQLNPPYEPDFSALTGDAPSTQRPTGFIRDLFSNGADFEGLIKTARIAAGLMLATEADARRVPADMQSLFWLHHTTCLLTLSMASDRLRSYFVLAVTGERLRNYVSLEGEPWKYALTFTRARDTLVGRGEWDPRIEEIVSSLSIQAERIAPYRARRNRMVHGIITRLGRDASHTVKREAELFDRRERALRANAVQPPNVEPVAASRRDGVESSALGEMTDWYALLLDTSSLVFELEYLLRRGRNSPQA